MISKFFIERPVLSNVIAILMILIGGVSLFRLAVAQYPDVVPPTAKMVIRMGNIHFSLPFNASTTRAIPALIAPVFMVTPRNPPMISTNMATSIAPNSSP